MAPRAYFFLLAGLSRGVQSLMNAGPRLPLQLHARFSTHLLQLRGKHRRRAIHPVCQSQGRGRAAPRSLCRPSATTASASGDPPAYATPTASGHGTSLFSQWEFAASSSADDSDGNANLIHSMLVCGDGDLSYGAAIAPALQKLGIDLTATVLEEEDVHSRVYAHSKSNADAITSSGQTAMFGVDATNLSAYFRAPKGREDDDNSSTQFDRIQFNFPHWRGKANNRYNRQLLSDFFESAATVLAPRGEIHVALCDGQGGCSATSLQEWRQSWTASALAAEHGLLLAKVCPYEPAYRLSSHRGVDRPFSLGKNPTMHVFVKPDGVTTASADIQLCCRHELHVAIPDDDGMSAVCSLDQILAGDAVETILQSACVPEGVRVEVPARQVLEVHETHGAARIAVFLVVYCGARSLVTRRRADEWRERAEREVAKYVPLRENRRGRTVSRPFPYPALFPEIKYHTTGER